MLTWFSFFLASLSCLITLAMAFSFARLRKQLRGASFRSLEELSTQVADLTSLYESLKESHKRLRSRYSMADLREKKAGNSVDEPDNDREKLRQRARQLGFRIT